MVVIAPHLLKSASVFKEISSSFRAGSLNRSCDLRVPHVNEILNMRHAAGTGTGGAGGAPYSLYLSAT